MNMFMQQGLGSMLQQQQQLMSKREQDALNRQLTQQQIEEYRAKVGQMRDPRYIQSKLPADIQTAQYYTGLTPDEQRLFRESRGGAVSDALARKGLIYDPSTQDVNRMTGFGTQLGGIESEKIGTTTPAEVEREKKIIQAKTKAEQEELRKQKEKATFEEKRRQFQSTFKETKGIFDELLSLNQGTIDAPYAEAFQPFLKVGGSDKATKLDLMKQARLELAAPMAKQLGVNPTDKDFQASLDRIFDATASKKSRSAQIQALQKRAKRNAKLYGVNNEVVEPAASVEDLIKKYGQ